MKKMIRLTESDLKNIIKKSVNKILKEGYDPYEDGDEYEEITDNLWDAYSSYIHAIEALQQFVYNHDDSAPDMYNSAAGKYGDEAKQLASQSYNRVSRLFYSDDEGL